MFEKLKMIGTIVGVFMAACVVGVAVMAMWSFIYMVVIGFLTLLVLCWACGLRLNMYADVDGKKTRVGYLRWFTFTKV